MVDWESLLDLKRARHELGLTQAQLADLLGVSPRVIQSCEQGWRRPSAAVQRSLCLLLLSDRLGARFTQQACWKVKACPPGRCENCVAFQSGQGHLCWLLTGNLCEGKRLRTWSDKKAVCGNCKFMEHLLNGARNG